MKSIITKLTMLLFVSATIIGCQDESTYYQGGIGQGTSPDLSTTSDSGFLSLSRANIVVNTSIEELYDNNEGTKTRSSDEEYDFLITITSTNLKDPVVINTTYEELNKVIASEGGFPLKAGDYDVKVITEALNPGENASVVVGEDNANLGKAKYQGKTSFTIKKGETTNIDEILCSICNIKTTLALSADLKAMFKADELCSGDDLPLRVAVEMNGKSYVFSGKDSNIAAYFDPAEESGTISVTLSGMYNTAPGDVGATYAKIDNWSQEIENVSPGQWRKINIHIEHTHEGDIKFVVTTESWVYDEVIDVDVKNLYLATEESIIDPELIPSATLSGATDNKLILATTGDVDPVTFTFKPKGGAAVNSATVTLPDVLGEEPFTIWPEPADNVYANLYTVTENPITHSVTVTATAEGMELLRTLPDGATGVNYSPTINVVDSRGYETSQDFSITVGEATPPVITWEGHDFETTYEVTADMKLVIEITSESELTGFTVDINSTVLTPEELSGSNLSQHMDLVNPGDLEPGLTALQFPIKDEIKGQNKVIFDITVFMPLLAGLGEGDSDFVLTITNKAGKVTSKTIKLTVK